jgi:hypothetical protein
VPLLQPQPATRLQLPSVARKLLLQGSARGQTQLGPGLQVAVRPTTTTAGAVLARHASSVAMLLCQGLPAAAATKAAAAAVAAVAAAAAAAVMVSMGGCIPVAPVGLLCRLCLWKSTNLPQLALLPACSTKQPQLQPACSRSQQQQLEEQQEGL